MTDIDNIDWKNAHVKRAKIIRYKKSDRYAAVVSNARYVGISVIYLSADLQNIKDLKTKKYIPRSSYDHTKFTAEVLEGILKETSGISVNYRLIRILEADDIDLEKWKSTSDLKSLPVSSHHDYTPEELAWAGQTSGNLFDGTKILLSAVLFISISIYLFPTSYFFILFGLLGVAFTYGAINHRWHLGSPPDPKKMELLKDRKSELARQSAMTLNSNLLQFDKRLNEFRNWRLLSPEQFEFALKLRMEKENYKVSMTKRSRDGGVDLEGRDHLGRHVIVQAKKYKGKVGVAVVREMIGVRQHHTKNPRTIVYALSGFTKGAQDLAIQAGIELRDIKKETLSN